MVTFKSSLTTSTFSMNILQCKPRSKWCFKYFMARTVATILLTRDLRLSVYYERKRVQKGARP